MGLDEDHEETFVFLDWNEAFLGLVLSMLHYPSGIIGDGSRQKLGDVDVESCDSE